MPKSPQKQFLLACPDLPVSPLWISCSEAGRAVRGRGKKNKQHFSGVWIAVVIYAQGYLLELKGAAITDLRSSD